jgi:hypothetical protein
MIEPRAQAARERFYVLAAERTPVVRAIQQHELHRSACGATERDNRLMDRNSTAFNHKPGLWQGSSRGFRMVSINRKGWDAPGPQREKTSQCTDWNSLQSPQRLPPHQTRVTPRRAGKALNPPLFVLFSSGSRRQIRHVSNPGTLHIPPGHCRTDAKPSAAPEYSEFKETAKWLESGFLKTAQNILPSLVDSKFSVRIWNTVNSLLTTFASSP